MQQNLAQPNEGEETSGGSLTTYAAGIGYSAMFGLSLGGMFMVQKLAQDISGVRIEHMIFIRQVVVLLLSYVQAKADGHDLSWMGYKAYTTYSGETRRLVQLRSILDWTAGLLLTFSIQLMPVSQSVSLSRLQVFVTPLLSFFIIDEKVSFSEIITIAGGFFGIMLIMNPAWFNTSQQTGSDIEKQQQLDQMKYPYLFIGMVLSILFAVIAAICIIVIRIQNRTSSKQVATVPISQQVYFYGVFTTIFVIVVGFFVCPEIFAVHRLVTQQYCMTLAQFFWYTSIGAFCWMYTLFAPKALQIIKSNTFVPFTNVATVISFLFDILYFKRLMLWSDYLGTLLIIFCTICLTMLAEHQDASSNSSDDFKRQNSKIVDKKCNTEEWIVFNTNVQSQQCSNVRCNPNTDINDQEKFVLAFKNNKDCSTTSQASRQSLLDNNTGKEQPFSSTDE